MTLRRLRDLACCRTSGITQRMTGLLWKHRTRAERRTYLDARTTSALARSRLAKHASRSGEREKVTPTLPNAPYGSSCCRSSSSSSSWSRRLCRHPRSDGGRAKKSSPPHSTSLITQTLLRSTRPLPPALFFPYPSFASRSRSHDDAFLRRLEAVP